MAMEVHHGAIILTTMTMTMEVPCGAIILTTIAVKLSCRAITTMKFVETTDAKTNERNK